MPNSRLARLGTNWARSYGVNDGRRFFHRTANTAIGHTSGILPGLGGSAGLALILPFVFGMDAGHALAMMIGLLSVTTTSDTFPSVLMGIPGTSSSQATVIDGFPLSKKGEAARALAAAFSASLLGGVFGAFVLTFAIYFAEPIIMTMGFGEQLMLIVLALTMVGMLTGTHPLKGLAACSLGMMMGSFGAAPLTGGERVTFGTDYLIDPLKVGRAGDVRVARDHRPAPPLGDNLGDGEARQRLASGRRRHAPSLVDCHSLLGDRLRSRRVSRAWRIGGRLDRLRPCGTDIQESRDLWHR